MEAREQQWRDRRMEEIMKQREKWRKRWENGIEKRRNGWMEREKNEQRKDKINGNKQNRKERKWKEKEGGLKGSNRPLAAHWNFEDKTEKLQTPEIWNYCFALQLGLHSNVLLYFLQSSYLLTTLRYKWSPISTINNPSNLVPLDTYHQRLVCLCFRGCTIKFELREFYAWDGTSIWWCFHVHR